MAEKSLGDYIKQATSQKSVGKSTSPQNVTNIQFKSTVIHEQRIPEINFNSSTEYANKNKKKDNK
ncbi:hypothetical protein ACLZHR_09620 [Priestia aryabhattai]|uniref:hypothetical protein n=1 Tax=Priestia aryabhattai TaxID=412384 RepID=UPI003A80FADD